MHLPLNAIEVEENRQRKWRHFLPEHLEKLAGSILESGLLHPVGVVRRPEGGWRLSYGECRLLAVADLAYLGQEIHHGVQDIPLGHIACIDLGALDKAESKEAEFAENDIRENIDFADRAVALAELHELRVEQAKARGEKHTLLATATEAMPIRASQQPTAAIRDISDSLLIVRHLDDPDVARAGSARAAIKVIEKKTERNGLLLAGLALAKVQKKSRHQLIFGRVEEELAKLPDASIDVLLTDPPYGVDAQNFGGQFTREAHFDDSPENWLSLIALLGRESYRIAKPEAHAYVFCDIQKWEDLKLVFSENGWYVWPWPIIWHKSGSNGALPRPEHGPRRMYEAILYAIKGDRKTLRIDSDIIAIAPVRDSPHPHAKPIELYANLSSRSARPGDVILDPFCGTAPLLQVAERQQLTAICIEADAAYFALAQKALEAL